MILFERGIRFEPKATAVGLKIVAVIAGSLLVGGVQGQVSLAQLARDVTEGSKGVAMSEKAPSQDSTGSTSTTAGATSGANSWAEAVAANQFKAPESAALQRAEGTAPGSGASSVQPFKIGGTDSPMDRPTDAEYRQGVQYMTGLNFAGEDPGRVQTRREIAIGMVSVGGLVLLGFGVRRAFFQPRTYH